MGLRSDYARHSARVLRSKQWQAVRLLAKRRDGFKCVQCGSRYGLEVDHIKPVRTHPEGSYALDNLQTLCGRCHARKTRIEVGMGVENPAREAWKTAVAELQRHKPERLN
ncbi:HNH endonuclease [Methylocystis bryophila]|uniref:Endonuclease n=1 Tax=Methylocystis bryophila TaxID=655015 RepID=A0A1W6MTN3_9HYPH|nr:endonuclease [Methylocystis bryophila]